MKKLVLTAAFFTAKASLAAHLSCSDKFWRLDISDDLKTAQLIGFEKPLEHPEMVCGLLPQYSLFLCQTRDRGINYRSFRALIRLGLPGEEYTAVLKEDVFSGGWHIADLKCETVE